MPELFLFLCAVDSYCQEQWSAYSLGVTDRAFISIMNVSKRAKTIKLRFDLTVSRSYCDEDLCFKYFYIEF